MEVRAVADDSEAERIHDAAQAAGLRIHSVMNQTHWRHPLSSPDPTEVEACVEGMRASLRQAELYGADAVLLVPAVVRSDTTYEQAWERSQREIRKLIPLAEKHDVMIAVEDVWNKFLLTARDFPPVHRRAEPPPRPGLLRCREHRPLRRPGTLDPRTRQPDCQGPSEGLLPPRRIRQSGGRRCRLARRAGSVRGGGLQCRGDSGTERRRPSLPDGPRQASGSPLGPLALLPFLPPKETQTP